MMTGLADVASSDNELIWSSNGQSTARLMLLLDKGGANPSQIGMSKNDSCWLIRGGFLLLRLGGCALDEGIILASLRLILHHFDS